MQPMDVGLMLGVGDDPAESIAKLQRVGVNNAQMGVPPDNYLSGDAYLKLKEQLKAAGIEITTVFCGFEGESYADIPTVKRTVGYVPEATREERIAKTFRIADFAKRLGA
ncbi:sugar phosphate isomerase/epimerase, partial [Candidatus Parcubacteria bacterium]